MTYAENTPSNHPSQNGETLPLPTTLRQGIDRQHLRRRIESDDLSIAEIWIGGTGAGAEVENDAPAGDGQSRCDANRRRDPAKGCG